MDAYADGRDAGSDWSDIEDVSDLLKARLAVYHTLSIPPHIRAPGDLAILWALNANSNFLVFWLLLRILSTSNLASRIRAEMADYIEVSTPPQVFGILESPNLKIDEKGLATSCPLLKACYIECLRLDSAPWSIRNVLKDFTVTESLDDALISSNGKSGGKPNTYVLKAGTYADVPWDLHFTDPRYFPAPGRYIPERHLRKPAYAPTGLSAPHSERLVQQRSNATPQMSSIVDESEGDAKHKNMSAEWGTVRPYGGGSSMCKGRLFAEREVLACVAGMLVLWDFEPSDSAGWKILHMARRREYQCRNVI